MAFRGYTDPREAIVWLWISVLGACGSDQRDAVETNPRIDVLVGTNQTLPAGVVGEAYQAQLAASGGSPPYSFSRGEDFPMPAGLVLASDGSITGVPYEAGVHQVQFIASDRVGQDQRFLATFEIALQPEILSCGDRKFGEFTNSAMTGAGPLWNAVGTPNLHWIEVPWPQGDNQRVELVLDAVGSAGVFVGLPNQPQGSLDWRNDYVVSLLGTDANDRVILDPGTTPSLSSFESQGHIPVLLVAFGPGAYTFDVVCTDGPVFRNPTPLPVPVGEDFVVDYDVYGDNATVTFDIEGELPDWVEVDEATGVLSGTALEEVGVPLVLTATDGDGRSRTIESLFGVYDTHPIGCDETVAVELDEGYYEGSVGGYFDPRGYRVFVLDVPPDVSAVDWTLDGEDGQYLGLVDHDEDQYFFFAGADQDFTTTVPARLTIDPRSYPAVKHYQQAGKMYVVTAPIAEGRALTLTSSCDVGPRPNLAGLPVVQPLSSIDERLDGIGGVPPYTFSASGLPSGLQIEDDRLIGASNAVGTYEIELTLSDSTGASYRSRYDLYVGLDEACDGGQRLSCGDALQGTLGGADYGDDPTSSQLCFVDSGVAAVGFEFSSVDAEFRVDVGDPGSRGSTFLANEQWTYVGLVLSDDAQAVALNAFGWPDLRDYDGLPVHLSVRSFDPGDWSVTVVCDPPTP